MILQRAARRRAIVAALAAVLLAACAPEPAPHAIALIDRFPEARKRSALPEVEAFSVQDATIAGVTRRAIYARPPSRLTWSVDVPAGARLELHMAVREDAWDRAGDGVVFRVGVSDGQTYTELLKQQVNPYGTPADRRWVPASINLSAFAGRRVDVILNTDHSPAGQPPSTAGDLALWGEPEIVG